MSTLPRILKFTISMIFSAIPLIIVFSLCYAATRHEDMRLILSHAVRFGGWLTFFMVLVVVIMELLYRYIH
ncbi:MAG: hypothetical protein LBP87_11340 [Planctomycetaceae bacterium]|nr:hypothetical protein [Planctomycetaceae bacterium]